MHVVGLNQKVGVITYKGKAFGERRLLDDAKSRFFTPYLGGISKSTSFSSSSSNFGLN